MATNPYVNKVLYGNQTVMDISDTDATESDVVSGKTFYKGSGARATGSAVIPDISNCYQTTDTAETDLADADYIPFYDSSASGKRKSLWSNIKAKLKTYFDGIYTTDTITDEIVKDTVGWTGKNLFDDSVTGTATSDTTYTVSNHVITVQNTSGTNKSARIPVALEKNIDVVVSGSIDVVAGVARVVLQGSSDESSYTDLGNTEEITSDGDFVFNGNTGNYNYYRVLLYCARSTSVAGQVVYSDLMIRKASIADSSYEPYHKTVEEVIEQVYADNGVLGAKNRFNAYDIYNNSQRATISNNGKIIQIADSTAGTYQSVSWILPVIPNTDYIFSGRGVVTSGAGLVSIRKTDDTHIKETNVFTTSKTINELFNTGDSTSIKILLYCTAGTSVTGNVTYTDTMLRLASDPDNTYVPYAMTNKEITEKLDSWTGTQQVANEQVTFTGLDDTQGWGYDPRIWIDDNSTNLNPYCKINSMTGAGTANMSITYDTDADNGAYVKLRILK